MSEIRGVLRIKIHPGKLDEFKMLAAKCMESVRTRDTGTLQYDLFFNADQSECLVQERYRDSDAVMEHMANLGDTMNALQQIGSMTGEFLGSPSPELRKSLEGSPVRIYRPYQSM